QRDAVVKVIQTGTMVIAGPVDIVQGGRAFVGRAPVYVSDENNGQRLWGIVSAPMLAESIYQMSGLETINDGLNIAIRGQDDILSSDVFYGDESTFTHPGAVVMPVSAGGSLWEIAA